jgi:ribose transport system ATP-binding protein
MPLMPPAPAAPLLELRNISKAYGGVRALTDVDFTARASSIHAVLGENGAGKSTLIKIVSGVTRPDSGTVAFEGRDVAFATPQEANAVGIVTVFQELSVMPDLSVADNISITRPPKFLGLIDHRAQRRRAEELLARVGCEDINPIERVRNLPLSRRQMVEIAKALGRNPKLLILDEATSALDSETERAIQRSLAELAKGRTTLVIAHRLATIQNADRIVVVDETGVAEQGRHQDLIAAGGIYRRLHAAQFESLFVG